MEGKLREKVILLGLRFVQPHRWLLKVTGAGGDTDHMAPVVPGKWSREGVFELAQKLVKSYESNTVWKQNTCCFKNRGWIPSNVTREPLQWDPHRILCSKGPLCIPYRKRWLWH